MQDRQDHLAFERLKSLLYIHPNPMERFLNSIKRTWMALQGMKTCRKCQEYLWM